MKFGSLDLTAKFGTKQIQKVVHGVNVIWENWKEYTLTKTAPSSGNVADSGLVITQAVKFTNDGTYKITSVSGTPVVQAHGDNQTLYAYVEIEGSNDNSSWTTIQRYDQESWTKNNGGTATGKTRTYSWSDGCPYKYIRVSCNGTSHRRMIKATFKGYKKG